MQIHTDYLILGGGIAGTTAAEAIRQKDGQGKIVILSAESNVLYSRVLLPKYVQGQIRREQVFLRSLADYEKKNIDLFSGEAAAVLDVERKEAHTSRGNTIFYDKLLISTGGEVRPWKVQSGDGIPPLRLQTIDDADKFKQEISQAISHEALLVGGGFIGLEIINCLVPKQFKVQCILRESRYWQDHLDETGSRLLQGYLERQGVTFHPSQEIHLLGRSEESGQLKVKTTRGMDLEGGLLAVGIGLVRDAASFAGKGIETDRGIKTNEFLETGAEGVFAAGDIAEFYSPVQEKHMIVGNWTNSFMQGRTAGLNMAASRAGAGELMPFHQVSAYSLNALGMHITFLGDAGVADEDVQTISRTDNNAFYERFFLKGNRLAGVVMINKFEDKKFLEGLIESRKDVSAFLGEFGNPSSDLRAVGA